MDTLKPTAVARRAALIAQAACSSRLCRVNMDAPPKRGNVASVAVISRPPLFNLRGL